MSCGDDQSGHLAEEPRMLVNGAEGSQPCLPDKPDLEPEEDDEVGPECLPVAGVQSRYVWKPVKVLIEMYEGREVSYAGGSYWVDPAYGSKTDEDDAEERFEASYSNSSAELELQVKPSEDTIEQEGLESSHIQIIEASVEQDIFERFEAVKQERLESFEAVDQKGLEGFEAVEQEGFKSFEATLEQEGLESFEATLKQEGLESFEATLEEEGLESFEATLEEEGLESFEAILEQEGLESFEATLEQEGLESFEASLEQEGLESFEATLEQEALESFEATLEQEELECFEPTLEQEGLKSLEATLEQDGLECFEATLEQEGIESFEAVEQEGRENFEAVEQEALESFEATLEPKDILSAFPSINQDWFLDWLQDTARLDHEDSKEALLQPIEGPVENEDFPEAVTAAQNVCNSPNSERKDPDQNSIEILPLGYPGKHVEFAEPSSPSLIPNFRTVHDQHELHQTLGPGLTFVFFFPDSLSREMEEPYRTSFVPKIQEIASHEPSIQFLTAYIDAESGAGRWNQWAGVLNHYYRIHSPSGPTFALFKGSDRMHEGKAYGSMALGNMVSELIGTFKDEESDPLDGLFGTLSRGLEVLRHELGVMDHEPKALVEGPENLDQATEAVLQGSEKPHDGADTCASEMALSAAAPAFKPKKSPFQAIIQDLNRSPVVQRVVEEIHGSINAVRDLWFPPGGPPAPARVTDWKRERLTKPPPPCPPRTESLIRNNVELEARVAGAGSKTVIVFLCLDTALSAEVVRGGFLPRLSQASASNPNLIFLRLVSEDEFIAWDPEATQTWDVPVFGVYRHGKELEQVSVRLANMATYLPDIERALDDLVERYGHKEILRVFSADWGTFFIESIWLPDAEQAVLDARLVAYVGNEEEFKVKADKDGLVVACFFSNAFPDVREPFSRASLPTLEEVAEENREVTFLCGQLGMGAWATESESYWPTILFYRDSRLVWEEHVISSFVLENTLRRLIWELKPKAWN